MSFEMQSPIQHDSLADVLERILDKGVVIAGDISISLVGIELLTIRLRLLIATVDKAKEMGINWWESDPRLTTQGPAPAAPPDLVPDPMLTTPMLAHPMLDRLARLEAQIARLADLQEARP